MRKAFKYRLYPNADQRLKMEQTLETCRHLYNDALAWRKEAYEMEKRSISYHEQAVALPAYKTDSPYLPQVHSQVLQDVLRRLDKSFKNFFRRVQEGENPGYPRFKASHRYNSFSYPQSGFGIVGRKLHLAKVGDVNIKLHRPIEGAVKTCTIRREVDHWFACFTVDLPDTPKVAPRTAVGIDVGLKSLVTLSTGEKVASPKFFRRSEGRLILVQRHLSRKRMGSTNRSKQRLRVARIYRTIRNQRLDFNHKLAGRLVDAYDLIAFEDLQVKNMLQNHHLAKSIADAGWNHLQSFTAYKAEWAGKQVRLVDPYGTTQWCSRCGTDLHLGLNDREFVCPGCGNAMYGGHNAAVNIRNMVGQELPEYTPAEIRPLRESEGLPQAPSLMQEATGFVRW